MINFYQKAFDSSFMAIWGKTKFINEVPLLSFARAMTCFLHNSDLGVEDRKKLIYTYLSAWFSTQKETDQLNKIMQNIPTENEVVMRVVENVCNLYKEAPNREYLGLTDKQKVYVEDIIKKSSFNSAIDQAFKIMWLAGECIMRPRQKEGKWWWEVIPPDLYRIEQDVNGKILEIWLPFMKEVDISQNRKDYYIYFHYWTPETYQQLDSDLNPIEFEYNGKMVTVVEHKYTDAEGNPSVPWVLLRSSENADVFGGGQWELIRAQLQINLLNYLIEENLVYGTVGFWLARNLGDYVKGETFALSPSKLIHITNQSIDDVQSDIEHKSAQAMFLELIDAKQRLTEIVLRNYSLPFSAISSNPNFPSGVAMLVDRWELIEKRSKFVDMMQKYENQLFQSLVMINNAEIVEPKLPFFEVNIDYADFELPYDIDKEIEIYQTKAELGVITPLTFVRKLSGNEFLQSDEEAIEFVKQNKEKFNELGLSKSSGSSSEPYSNPLTGTLANTGNMDSNQSPSSTGEGITQ